MPLPFFKSPQEQLLTPSWEKPGGPLRRPRRPNRVVNAPNEIIEPLYPVTPSQQTRRQEPISPRPATSAPARLPYSHPTRKAARIVAREQRTERIAKYIAQGLGADEAAKRATADAYKDATSA